jgi:hypothetical protein
MRPDGNVVRWGSGSAIGTDSTEDPGAGNGNGSTLRLWETTQLEFIYDAADGEHQSGVGHGKSFSIRPSERPVFGWGDAEGAIRVML